MDSFEESLLDDKTTCIWCNAKFNRSYHLKRHQEKACTSSFNRYAMQEQIRMMHNKMKKMAKSVSVTGNQNITNESGTVISNSTINITVNPVQSLNYDYITESQIRSLSEHSELSNFITSLLANPRHPENHSVKTVSKNPMLYSIKTTDKNGEIMNVIRNLKDACTLINKPVVQSLNERLDACLSKYSAKIIEDDSRYSVAQILELRAQAKKMDRKHSKIREELINIKDLLKKECVWSALETVLKTDILFRFADKIDHELASKIDSEM